MVERIAEAPSFQRQDSAIMLTVSKERSWNRFVWQEGERENVVVLAQRTSIQQYQEIEQNGSNEVAGEVVTRSTFDIIVDYPLSSGVITRDPASGKSASVEGKPAERIP